MVVEQRNIPAPVDEPDKGDDYDDDKLTIEKAEF